jgi:hypothetical protein
MGLLRTTLPIMSGRHEAENQSVKLTSRSNHRLVNRTAGCVRTVRSRGKKYWMCSISYSPNLLLPEHSSSTCHNLTGIASTTSTRTQVGDVLHVAHVVETHLELSNKSQDRGSERDKTGCAVPGLPLPDEYHTAYMHDRSTRKYERTLHLRTQKTCAPERI